LGSYPINIPTCGLSDKDVHYGTFRGSGIFQNLYFESIILNPILE